MKREKKLEMELNQKIDMALVELRKEGKRPSPAFIEKLRAYASYYSKHGVAPYKNEVYTFNKQQYELGKWILDLKIKEYNKALDPTYAKLLLAVDDKALTTQRAFFTSSMIHRVHAHTRGMIDPATQQVLVNYEVRALSAQYSNVMFGVDENGLDRDRLSNGQPRERFANFPESAIELNMMYDKNDGTGKKGLLFSQIARCIIFDKSGPDSRGNYKILKDQFVWRIPAGMGNSETFQINIAPKNVPQCLMQYYNTEKKILTLPIGEKVPSSISIVERGMNQCRVNLDSSKATIHFGYERGSQTPASISIGNYRQHHGEEAKETEGLRFGVNDFQKLFPDKRIVLQQEKKENEQKAKGKSYSAYAKNAKSHPTATKQKPVRSRTEQAR